MVKSTLHHQGFSLTQKTRGGCNEQFIIVVRAYATFSKIPQFISTYTFIWLDLKVLLLLKMTNIPPFLKIVNSVKTIQIPSSTDGREKLLAAIPWIFPPILINLVLKSSTSKE